MRRNTKVGLETNGRANARLETKGRAVGGSVMNGRSKTKSVARKSARKEIATTRGGGGVLGAWFAVVTAGLASLGGPPALAGPVEIIDDKSDFDGLNFTVIDFETRGDGSLYDFGASNIAFLPPSEYEDQGVRIIATPEALSPVIVRGVHPMLTQFQSTTGSPFNTLTSGHRHAEIRFEFINEISAVGVAVNQTSESDPFRLEAYDSEDNLIGALVFDDSLIDGRAFGADFGATVDHAFGFAGIRASESQIAYAIAYEDLVFLDDLHFAVVPEPQTLVLFLVLTLLGVTRSHQRCIGRALRSSTAFLLLSLCNQSIASAAITGQVTGYVIIDEKRICGPGGPSGCAPITFVERPLEGVCVRLPGGACAFTDAAGQYTLEFSEPGTTTVEATLSGLSTHAGTLDVDALTGFFIITLSPTIAQQNVSSGGTANFVFNAVPDTTTHTGEVLAASVSTYYHMERIHRLLKDRQPDLVEIDSPLGAALDQVLPGEAGFLVTTLDGPIATFPPTSPLLVQPNYADRATMAGKSSVQRV